VPQFSRHPRVVGGTLKILANLTIEKMKLTLILLSLAVCHGGSLDDETRAKIDEFITTIMGCRGGIAMSLGVVDGNEEMVKGYGVKDITTHEPTAPNTLFDIGSVSKHFATTLLGILLDEHERFTWDTPVRDILGEDLFFYDGLRTNRTTLRDMAAHTTGLNRNDFLMFTDNTRLLVAEKIRFSEPLDRFRTSFQYNNLMYGLIAVVTEKIGGKSWDELLKERLFDPVGMEDSTTVSNPDVNNLDTQQSYLPDGLFLREVSWGALRYYY
jgi:CubicO group peptidase (beta-lactamase class C family)